MPSQDPLERLGADLDSVLRPLLDGSNVDRTKLEAVTLWLFAFVGVMEEFSPRQIEMLGGLVAALGTPPEPATTALSFAERQRRYAYQALKQHLAQLDRELADFAEREAARVAGQPSQPAGEAYPY